MIREREKEKKERGRESQSRRVQSEAKEHGEGIVTREI
jgi:hypothetical protein